MSTSGHGPSKQDLEGDGVDMPKILMVGVGSLTLFALSAIVAYFMLRYNRNEYDAQGRPPAPTMIGKPEIGIVDQPEFSNDNRLEEWKRAKQFRLNSYGWVDRKKEIIHIPIDKAIDQVVSEAGNQP
jgi:hypothetical protein